MEFDTLVSAVKVFDALVKAWRAGRWVWGQVRRWRVRRGGRFGVWVEVLPVPADAGSGTEGAGPLKPLGTKDGS